LGGGLFVFVVGGGGGVAWGFCGFVGLWLFFVLCLGEGGLWEVVFFLLDVYGRGKRDQGRLWAGWLLFGCWGLEIWLCSFLGGGAEVGGSSGASLGGVGVFWARFCGRVGGVGGYLSWGGGGGLVEFVRRFWWVALGGGGKRNRHVLLGFFWGVFGRLYAGFFFSLGSESEPGGMRFSAVSSLIGRKEGSGVF